MELVAPGSLVSQEDGGEPGAISASTSNLGDFFPTEEAEAQQRSNNSRANSGKTQEAGLSDKARYVRSALGPPGFGCGRC